MKCAPFLSGIFLVSLALRIIAITVPIDRDEVWWISRGITFIQNLLEGNLADTYLTHHPGVPNMWIIGSAMLLNCLVYKVFPGLLGMNQPLNLDVWVDTNTFPINLYVIPRLLQAAITSACMVGIYILTKKLLGRAVALCSISLLILEPFFLAHQRFLTTNALLADFSALALLFFILYLRGDGNYRLLIASGVLMGLAIATKIPALFVLPGIVIWIALIELRVWRASFPQRGWKRQIRDIILWGMTIIAVIFLLWPALWVAPLETMRHLVGGLLKEDRRGYFFFLGQITDSPGLLFYPFVLAYRLSPILQVGLLGLSVLLIPWLRRATAKVPELAAIAIIPLCVLVMFSFMQSKLERYINLILPELALLAAVGWLAIGACTQSLLKAVGCRWRNRVREQVTTHGVTIAIALILGQLVILLPHYPYYVTYYNPLLGGSRVAQNLFMVGQGEGLDQVAHWLNQLPNAKEITAASWYPEVFGAYFQGKTLPITKYADEPDYKLWAQASHVIIYCNQFQRQLPKPNMVAYFAGQQPLYTLQLHDIDYVQLYPGPVPLPKELESIQMPLFVSFGEQVRLLGYELNTSEISPSDELVVTFYWEFLAPSPPDSRISISLRDRDQNLWSHSEDTLLNSSLPVEQITSGTVLRDVHKLIANPDIPPGHYYIEVTWFLPNEGQALEVRHKTGNSQEQAVIGEVEIVRSSILINNS